MTVLRVMPSRHPAEIGGVQIVPSRATNTFSPQPAGVWPPSFSMIAPPHPAFSDAHVDRRVERVHPHLPVTAERERTHVARGKPVGPDDLLRGLRQRLARIRDLHVVELRGPEEPAQVF